MAIFERSLMPNKKRAILRPTIVEKYLGSKRQKKTDEVVVSLSTDDEVHGHLEVVLEHKTQEGKYTPAYE